MCWGLIARVALDNKMQGSGSTKRTKEKSGSFTSSSSGADRKGTGRKVARSNQHE
jgi:hypothetical protein